MSNDFSEWIGRTETVVDDMSPATAQAAAATFCEDADSLAAGGALPPLWHWFYFLSAVPQSQLGLDGHPQRTASSFMPPIPLPRRMFAGARITWLRPLRLGRSAERRAEIRDIQSKSGRSGDLAFVTVASQVFQDGLLCLDEQQDIVYRTPGEKVPAPPIVELPPLPAGTWSQTIVPDPKLLFRFSALTFNAHRIHYDRPYAADEEGYPGLVVHGPLTALLLLQLARKNEPQGIASFSFRGKAPLFDLAAFRLAGVRAGKRIELRAEGPDGAIAMEAVAEIAP